MEIYVEYLPTVREHLETIPYLGIATRYSTLCKCGEITEGIMIYANDNLEDEIMTIKECYRCAEEAINTSIIECKEMEILDRNYVTKHTVLIMISQLLTVTKEDTYKTIKQIISQNDRFTAYEICKIIAGNDNRLWDYLLGLRVQGGGNCPTCKGNANLSYSKVVSPHTEEDVAVRQYYYNCPFCGESFNEIN